jgi:hypothetical protein
VDTKLVQLADVGGKAVDGAHLTIGSTSWIVTRPASQVCVTVTCGTPGRGVLTLSSFSTTWAAAGL